MQKLLLNLLFTYLLFNKEIKDFIVNKMVQKSMRDKKINETVIKAFIISHK